MSPIHRGKTYAGCACSAVLGVGRRGKDGGAPRGALKCPRAPESPTVEISVVGVRRTAPFTPQIAAGRSSETDEFAGRDPNTTPL